jgi:hypothetical protein
MSLDRLEWIIVRNICVLCQVGDDRHYADAMAQSQASICSCMQAIAPSTSSCMYPARRQGEGWRRNVRRARAGLVHDDGTCAYCMVHAATGVGVR